METRNELESVNAQQGQPTTGQVTNPLNVVDNMVNEALQMPTDVEVLEQKQLEELESMRMCTYTEVPPISYTLSVDGVGFFALNDVHALKAKQKQGKTTALKVCVGAMLSGQLFRVKSEQEEPSVMWLDTEQQPADVKLIINDIVQMTGLPADYIDSHLMLYRLRKRTYETLMGDLQVLVKAHRPQAVVIDGVVEFVSSFNNEELSHQTVNQLKVMSEDYQCAIICVLHENKAIDDQNMRGHLGTFLSQAAGSVLSCQKSKQEIITVKCTDPRHGTMPEWSIRYDSDGHIVDADMLRQQAEAERQAKDQQTQADKWEAVRKERDELAFQIVRQNPDGISRNELVKMMAQDLDKAEKTIYPIVGRLVKDHMLREKNGLLFLNPTSEMS